jgi:hypothetical protein
MSRGPMATLPVYLALTLAVALFVLWMFAG